MDIVDQALRKQRRTALSTHSYLKGIDFIEVKKDPTKKIDNYYLELYFISEAPNADMITPDNIRFSKGDRPTKLRVKDRGIEKEENSHYWKLSFEARFFEKDNADYIDLLATYTLTLVNIPHIDPFFNQVIFIFQVEKPAAIDPLAATVSKQSSETAGPEIDYLARDYQGFRKLMLNRMSLLIPKWQANNSVDPGVIIVEALAYAADQLSYFQDAVATEAYLGTARRRVSVKRHARLLDYMMHEGCNARVWVQIQVKAEAGQVQLSQGVPLLSRMANQTTHIVSETTNYQQIMAKSPMVFEILYPVTLFSEHNALNFYSWEADEFTLPQGATKATLEGLLNNLQVGDVLIFEQVKGTKTGMKEDVGVTQRHAVRLTKVIYRQDALGNFTESDNTAVDIVDITDIEWHVQDALPFAFPVATVIGNRRLTNITVALGNIVLADHGRSITQELEPNIVPERGYYRPSLKHSNITFKVPFDVLMSESLPAHASLQQKPRMAQPVIELKQGLKQEKINWTVRPDLLSSNRFARDFVIEVENNRQVFVRFGDGNFGRQPSAGAIFQADYRIGNGSIGNIGAETLAHIVVTEELVTKIGNVRNPLPAQGGLEPERLEQVRQHAPQLFWRQQRCVTEQDYAEVATQHPEVKRAAASLHWTGSWHTIYIAVDRKTNLPIDSTFKKEFMQFIRQFRMINHDIHITTPHLISLDIALVVHMKPGYFPNVVKQQLLKHFSNYDLPSGQRGFFHTDNFGYGKSVYLSQMVTEAMSIPGVAWIDTKSFRTRFQRWNQAAERTHIEAGYIPIGKLEIVQLDNNPAAPENGRLEFFMERAT